ncbi:RelA/SpoT family protein [Nocardioides sp. Root1257]|uniref:RelA/SpoT family protein n=1 Tax=unclassified Nocardioides TaxID=2615069 RepID=UPI0039E0542D
MTEESTTAPAPAGPRRASEPGPSTRSMRARLARMGTRGQTANPVLEPLFRSVRANHPKADLALLERAYLTAEKMHGTQTRKSGDPYITHPLAVTTILADIGMTESTLAAALLHDTVEDTPYTLEQVRQDFGDEVAQLVDGVTKLDKVKYGDSAQAETIRKMIVAMSRDIRVLVIKLADRLHNMRTLRYVRQETQERVARETLDIYAPLAHRLGMNTIKWELEDLAFATLHPKIYDEIVRMVAERAPSRDQFLAEVINQVDADLREAKVKCTVTGRPKHYYSIYQKMIVGGREFSDIYDLVGIRVLVEDDRDCYTVLGVLHSRWNPVLGRFKDYVAMPKFNMYQSLHTTVIGPQGKPVELQIRTYAMHRRAEYGVAAHWKYKEDGRNGVDTDRPGDVDDMTWVRQLLDWQNEVEDPGEFLESLRFEINRAEVYVFTPRGDVIALPTGATPVDFAYAVHTEVGHHTIGARVNGRLVPLESGLENGDVVEVFTSKSPTAGPSRDWLGFVKSPRARSKIRQWFTKERREEAIDRGKEQIAKLMRKEGLPLKRLMSHESLMLAAVHFKLADVSALYAAVGEGNLSAQAVVRRVIDVHGGDGGAAEDLAEGVTITGRRGRAKAQPGGDSGVIVKGAPDVWVKLAKCCTPVPPDPILGFVTKGGGVSVHRQSCTNAASLQSQPERLLDVEWAPTGQSSFLVNIQVEALDRARLLSDITMALSDAHVDILSANLSTSRDRVAKSRFTFEMAEAKHLDTVLKAVRSVPGVFDAYRVTQ